VLHVFRPQCEVDRPYRASDRKIGVHSCRTPNVRPGTGAIASGRL
jgi:hypothetical protein